MAPLKQIIPWYSLCTLFLPLIALGGGKVELQSAGGTLVYDDGQFEILRGDVRVIHLTSLRFDYTEPTEWKLLGSSDQVIRIELTFPPVVDFMHRPEDTDSRSMALEVSVVDGGFRFRAEAKWAKQTTLVFDYLGDHFFGISEPLQPDNQLSPDLTGAVVNLEVKSESTQLAENFASAFSAFYISTLGYGSFFDTFARGHYDFAINGANRIHHDTGKLDWYVFLGNDGVDIHRSYFNLIGSPKKVPLWAVGPVGWRDQNDGGAAEILDDISKFTDLKMPLTAWFVDRPYSDGAHAWSEMNFSEAFADPGKWIGSIREDYGMEFMTWTSTATFGDERFSKHLKGNMSYIDLSDPDSYDHYKQELTDKQYRYGVRGHKMDRADEYLPVYENWADGTPIAERRNRYAYLFAKVHHEALQEAWGDDQVNFARAGIHRAQPYLTALWGGDPRTNWDGLQGNLANAIRCGFMGFPIWGTDVGGYLGEGYIPEDIYIRWLQMGSMNGLFEIKFDGSGGEGRDRMPGRYDEEFQAVVRSIFEDRMLLLPYLYSLANTSATSGVLMQPMAYRHLDDPKTYGIWDQFYVGEGIMVAPVVTPGTRRSVYLPEGEWHDFDDLTKRFSGGRTIEVDAPLTKFPRFVRGNSLYLTGHYNVGNAKNWNSSEPSLTIHAIPGAEGETTEFTYIDPLDGNKAKVIRMAREKGLIRISAPSMTCPVTVEVWTESSRWKIIDSSRDTVSENEIMITRFPSHEKISLFYEKIED